MVMKCNNCDTILVKPGSLDKLMIKVDGDKVYAEPIIETVYTVSEVKTVLEYKQAYCPVCGCVLKRKDYHEVMS